MRVTFSLQQGVHLMLRGGTIPEYAFCLVLQRACFLVLHVVTILISSKPLLRRKSQSGITDFITEPF